VPEQCEARQYIYCVIDMRENSLLTPFAVAGDGGAEAALVRHADIAAVVARRVGEEDACEITRDNVVGHVRVIEQVMREHTALPVRFGTVAQSADAIREQVLARRYEELRELMERMADKDEMGVKVFWRDHDAILQEVAEASPQIRHMRSSLAARTAQATYYQKIELGRLVQSALDARRDREGEEIARRLAQAAEDFRLQPARGERIVLDSAYLVDRRRMQEFDQAVSDLAQRNEQRLKVKYVGPVAPFNFVNLSIQWDEP